MKPSPKALLREELGWDAESEPQREVLAREDREGGLHRYRKRARGNGGRAARQLR